MDALRERFDAVQTWFESLPARMTEAHDWINTTFGPTMKTIFAPTNNVFTYVPKEAVPFVSTECAVMLFQLAIVGVLFLNPRYVNIDRPNNRFWNDLRLWTILSMVPHMYIYRIF
jgi:hypothetical protein